MHACVCWACTICMPLYVQEPLCQAVQRRWRAVGGPHAWDTHILESYPVLRRHAGACMHQLLLEAQPDGLRHALSLSCAAPGWLTYVRRSRLCHILLHSWVHLHGCSFKNVQQALQEEECGEGPGSLRTLQLISCVWDSQTLDKNFVFISATQ